MVLLVKCQTCLWAALGLLASLALVAQPARAAVTEAWVQRYSTVVTNSNDEAVKVVRDAAGDIIVTGNSEGDMLTIKYSGADGSVLWQKRYNGPANGNDFAQAVALDSSGNVVVTGTSNSDGRNTNGIFLSDYYTAKYASANGTLLWERLYDSPGNGTDFPTAMAVDGNGNVVVTGVTGFLRKESGGSSDYYTAKYAAADGALLWEQRYNGSSNRATKPKRWRWTAAATWW